MTSILLIEDSRDLAEVVRRELVSSGYIVTHTLDGESGLLAFRQSPPDLVILDWMLPGMDGLEVLRELQTRGAVPVMMLTARGEEADRVIGLELGADDYLSKPFSMRELVARVHALLRRAERVQQLMAADRQGPTGRLQWQELTLNPEFFQAWINDQELELTRIEFELLSLLLRNPGRVFSRNYLLEAVWEQQYIEGDRSVDNTILRLRRKLGEMGDSIETVWGVGYRLRKTP